MIMKLKNVFTIGLVFMLIFANIICVQASAYTVTISSVYNEDTRIVVEGAVSSGMSQDITILMTDENDEIEYIDQRESNSDGSFRFCFRMIHEEKYGRYKINVGGENVDEPAVTYFNYESPVVETEVISGNIDVDINFYVPTVSGSFECFEGRQLDMTILNTTDYNVIAQETIRANNGLFNFSYELPSLLYPKSYDILIECKNGDVSLASMNVTVSSSTLALALNGNMTVAENVRLAGSVYSSSPASLNKSFNITKSTTLSYDLPNLAAYMNVTMDLSCYESVDKTSEMDDADWKIRTIDICAKENLDGIMVYNYPWDELEPYVWLKITWDKEYIELLDIVNFHDNKLEFINETDEVVEIKYKETSGPLFRMSFKMKKTGNTQMKVYQHR